MVAVWFSNLLLKLLNIVVKYCTFSVPLYTWTITQSYGQFCQYRPLDMKQ